MAQNAGGGGSRYDDAIIRTRLAQAFGRLIRRHEDRGRFVMLSGAMPSRLLSAFPVSTPVHRLTLDAALERIARDPMVHADIASSSDSGMMPAGGMETE
jgi:ATP-dependent DNA helicase DinG